MNLWRALLLVVGLLLLALPLHAQEETDEAEETVPYFQSTSNFNVPLLDSEGWVSQGDDERADYVNESLNARIDVTSVDTQDLQEAIDTLLAQMMDEPLPEPFYTTRIGIPTGTWLQALYSSGDVSISAFSVVRNLRSYVIVFMEDDPEMDIYHLVVRAPFSENEAGEQAPDVALGVQETMTALLGDFDLEPESSEVVVQATGEWLVYNYPTADTPLQMRTLQLDTVLHMAFTRGDATNSAALSDAFQTVFLGFFITPDNEEFLYLGLAFVAGIFLVLLGSYGLRYYNARKDYALVQQLAEEERQDQG